jgi:hypothetical protein
MTLPELITRHDSGKQSELNPYRYINIRTCLIFVDPCIIVQFIKKIQQDATIYQNDHTVPGNVHQPHVQQPFTYEKPEAASAVLGY